VDPWEFRNLAGVPEHAERLKAMRGALLGWQEATGDACAPESPEVYALEVAAARGGRGADNGVFDRNVELMKRWREERPVLEGPGEGAGATTSE
jgi:hypothetical protein